MHLLILGMNYAPEPTGIAPYTTDLAEHLVGRGHAVTVATAFPHYPQWQVQPPYTGRWQILERRAGVEVRRRPVFLPRGGSALSRICYDTSFALGALLDTATVARADAVLCVSPPLQHGLIGAALARRWRAPLVLLVQDLPLDAALALGMLRDGPALRTARGLERCVYRLAGRIIVISAGFGDTLRRRGVSSHRLVEIPNWVDTDRFCPRSPDPTTRALLGAGPNDYLVLYAGSMGPKQGLTTALEAAHLLRSAPHFKLALVGDGPARPELAAEASRLGLDNMRLLPLQPPEAMPQLLAAADLLLLTQRRTIVNSVVPSKLLGYMAVGRPVVAAVHPASEAATIVRSAGCGLVVSPDNPRVLADAISAIAAAPGWAAALGAAGRCFANRRYARSRVLARYETFFAELLRQYGSHAGCRAGGD